MILYYIFLSLLVTPLLSDKAHDILMGLIPPTEEDFHLMYAAYVNQYKDEPMLSGFSIMNGARYSIFKENVKYMINHNKQIERTYEMGINQFAALTHEEFLNIVRRAPQDCSATQNPILEKISSEVPPSMDWRDKGVVTKVKNQGGCGSCWSFSTTGATESHWAILKKLNPPIELSEQQLIDCSRAYGNKGCSGGLPSQAFEYIKDFGLEKAADYPYEGRDRNCRYKKEKVEATVPGGSYNITQNDENKILEIVGTIGPVSIAFDCTIDFEFYMGGIYSSILCRKGPHDVNHAVLVVGYGTEKGKDYWIVKNSWGGSWGEKGYFRIVRGKNMCGLAVCASYPLMNA